MAATVRRYDGIDTARSAEIVRTVDETLIPALSELERFEPSSPIDSGTGALTSIVSFESPAQGGERPRPVAEWVRVEELESALPHPPAIPTRTAAARGSAEGGLAGVVQPSTSRRGGPAQVPVLQWPTMLKGGRMAMLAQLVARLRGALKK
jgi:hypothetical protein